MRAAVEPSPDRQRQDLHTAGVDIIDLLCLQAAKAGARIVASYAVYNEMLAHGPDLVEVLYWDRNDEPPDGEAPFFPLPVFSDLDGARASSTSAGTSATRNATLTPPAHRRPARSDRTARVDRERAGFYVEMDGRPGDIQLLDNAKILYFRQPYENFRRSVAATPPAPAVACRAPLRQRRSRPSPRHP